MQAPVDSDEQLMAQIRAGDQRPLSILLTRWAPSLWTFLLRMLGDRPRAEAMFQEVFLALWIHRRRYAYPRPFCIWLMEIAAKKCIHRHRHGRHHSSAAEHSARVPPAGSAITAPVAQEVDPAVVLNEAMLRLPSRERAVLVLRIWIKLSYAEIARITGRHEVLVRAQMADALTRVRRHWERRRPASTVTEGQREC
jgi:RNA polymerase sigma-70 factor (ECF subfamily)